MNEFERNKAVRRIKRQLKKDNMTLDDLGVDGSLSDASDEILTSILEDIDEDNAREANRKLEERESLEYAESEIDDQE